MNRWMQTCYSRLLIDNHITEDDPSFMSRFDPQRYAALVKKSGVEAAMVYACDHNGNCYYPSEVGHVHRGLNGRDIFGETVHRLRQAGIHPIAYYTSIYHNHSAKSHPDWRMQDPAGKQQDGRYWWSCPNNAEYRAFTRAQVAEVISYDVDGIFVDMTFWPVLCCCHNCREAFRQLTGQEIPETIQWDSPAWMAFQHFREASLVNFCEDLAESIKTIKPITVTFQNSPIIFGWSWGQTPGIANACDYVSGDFYGGKYQHILGAKILSASSKTQPFEYMTSRCVNLNDHTSMKSEAELRCEAATTLASGGAYFFIDAINPDGSLMEPVYERLGSISSWLAPFTRVFKEHRPILSADTGLYFSMASFINLALNGCNVSRLPGPYHNPSTPSYEEMLGTSIVLARAHRPFMVVRDAEGDLSQLSTLVINNACVMSDPEVEKVREFVRHGGTLIATGLTSLFRLDGSSRGNFALADVFGVTYTGGMSRRINYLTLPGPDNLVSCSQPAALVQLAGAEALAGLSEPLFDPDDPLHYASIHSNPPGRLTPYTGLAQHPFGLGKCIYLAQPLLTLQQDAQQSFGAWLMETFAPTPWIVQTDAPACVEITLLRSTTQKTLFACLVNYQKELPNVPVSRINLTLNLKGQKPTTVKRVSDGQAIPYSLAQGNVTFEIKNLETLEIIEIC